MSRFALPMLLSLVGCKANGFELILLSGRVVDAPTETAQPIADASLASFDINNLQIGSATSNEAGEFAIDLESGQAFFLTVEAEGHTSTAFSGLAGLSSWSLEEGDVWMPLPEELTALREEFSGCSRAAMDGAIVAGTVRIYIPGNEAEDLPLVTTATATAWTPEGASISGCYLDDDGASFEDGELSGQTGRFAIFGINPGPISIELSYDVPDESGTVVATYSTWKYLILPEEGYGPLDPAYVELPT